MADNAAIDERQMTSDMTPAVENQSEQSKYKEDTAEQ
jgi:hypothetical protein